VAVAVAEVDQTTHSRREEHTLAMVAETAGVVAIYSYRILAVAVVEQAVTRELVELVE